MYNFQFFTNFYLELYKEILDFIEREKYFRKDLFTSFCHHIHAKRSFRFKTRS